jgi:hypothetical protein
MRSLSPLLSTQESPHADFRAMRLRLCPYPFFPAVSQATCAGTLPHLQRACKDRRRQFTREFGGLEYALAGGPRQCIQNGKT